MRHGNVSDSARRARTPIGQPVGRRPQETGSAFSSGMEIPAQAKLGRGTPAFGLVIARYGWKLKASNKSSRAGLLVGTYGLFLAVFGLG